MHEICFCGWAGDVTEREPVPTGDGGWALACPRCGHLDDLRWLSVTARQSLVAQTRHRATDATADVALAGRGVITSET
jgi:hypothetical protein